MGAPIGNCNAAKNKAKCRSNKGWYSRSGSKTYLKNVYKTMIFKQRAAEADESAAKQMAYKYQLMAQKGQRISPTRIISKPRK